MRYIFLIFLISSLSLIGASCVKNETSTQMPTASIINKKALIIIAFEGFQDLEYSKTREVLEAAGVKITIASSSLGIATGKLGKRVETDITINETRASDYDAIIFIGGPGAVEYIDNSQAHVLAQEAIKANKILAAICIAPEILAKAGVLKNKKATVWSSILDRSPIEVLQKNGAQYLDQEVVIDGKIITANGPGAAEKFGQAILEQLK